jgi:hypothetical protein
LVRRSVNERPRLLDEFNQATFETQPLALKRIRLASTLRADLADQAKQRAGVGHAPL